MFGRKFLFALGSMCSVLATGVLCGTPTASGERVMSRAERAAIYGGWSIGLAGKCCEERVECNVDDGACGSFSGTTYLKCVQDGIESDPQSGNNKQCQGTTTSKIPCSENWSNGGIKCRINYYCTWDATTEVCSRGGEDDAYWTPETCSPDC